MTVAPFPGVPWVNRPLHNVTPFTYSDGTTMLQILERMSEHLSGPFADDIAEFVASVDDRILDNQEQMNTALSEFVAEVDSRFGALAASAAQVAVDAYLANPSTLDKSSAQLVEDDTSALRTALNAASALVAHRVVGSAPLVVVHGDDLNTRRPVTPRPVTWAGTVRPYNMAEQDVWDRYRGETSVFEGFDGPGFAGWTPMWTEPSSWAVQSGSLVHTPTVGGRKALTCDEVGSVVDVEMVARVSRTGTTGSVGAGLVARASGTTAQADNVVAACFNNMLHLSHTVRGSWQGLASAPFTIPTEPYWIRFQVQNQHLRAKAWVDGTSEPSGWMVETVQWTINGPGRAGAMASENAGQQWDQIGFGIGTSAPVTL